MDELQAHRDEWALAIGRFIVAFASCEYWTYLYIRTYGSAREREEVDDQKLWKRLSVMEGVLLRLRLKPEIQERVDKTLKGFRAYTDSRNILAHNAPMVHIYVHEKTGEMQVRHELRSEKDLSKDVTVEQLEREAAELAEIEEELALLYGLIRQPASRSA